MSFKNTGLSQRDRNVEPKKPMLTGRVCTPFRTDHVEAQGGYASLDTMNIFQVQGPRRQHTGQGSKALLTEAPAE